MGMSLSHRRGKVKRASDARLPYVPAYVKGMRAQSVVSRTLAKIPTIGYTFPSPFGRVPTVRNTTYRPLAE